MKTISIEKFFEDYVKMSNEYAVHKKTKKIYGFIPLTDSREISIREVEEHHKIKEKLQKEMEGIIDRIFK